MLPIIEERYHTMTLNSEKIEYRLWKTKEEKEFLIQRELKGDMTFEEMFDILVKPLIKDYDKYNFSLPEKMYILTVIRKGSIGEDIELGFVCPKCETYQTNEIEIDDIVSFQENKFNPQEGITIGDYVFYFKKNTSKKVSEMVEKAKTNVEKDNIQLAASIYKIEYKGTTYEDFTFDEMMKFLDDLPTNVFDKLFDKYSNLVEKISFDYSIKCPNCGNIIYGNLENISDFLWG